MNRWESDPLFIDRVELKVIVNDDGAILGMTVNNSYASDLLLNAEQARQLAALLLTGADHAELIKGKR